MRHRTDRPSFRVNPLAVVVFAACALGLLPLGGCGNNADPIGDNTQTVCSPGVAQIAVGDGYLQSVCGCAEGVQLVGSGTSIKCTVSQQGAIVVFSYLTPRLKHQIVPTSADPATSFAASGVFTPGDRVPTRAHAAQLGSTGTYPFTDAFDTGLSGSFIVP